MTVILNRPLVLETATRAPDGAGGFTLAWTPLGTLWAAVLPGTPRTLDQPGGAERRVPLRITVRGAAPGAPSRPQAGQRFRDGARTYPIAQVSEADPQGRHLLCLAHEDTAP